MSDIPTENADSPASSSKRPGLLRALGLKMALAVVVGNVIGSGIFLKPGTIAQDVGQFGWIIFAWVLGGIVCIFGALCFAELAAMMPRAGGLYVYLKEAYGRPVAFMFGWSEFLFSRPAAIGALSVAFVATLGLSWNLDDSFQQKVVSIFVSLSLITAMAAVNIIGIVWGGRVQVATTIVKAGFLAVIAVLPFVLPTFGFVGAKLANFLTVSTPPESTTLVTQFAAAMLAVMWAYNGWHGITPVAEEVRDPGRNIPLSLFGGVGILIVLYVSVNCAYHSILTMEEAAQAGTGVPQAMFEKMLASRGESVSSFGGRVLAAVIMCSLFGAINSNFMNGPRVSFAMGRDKIFISRLGNVHPTYRTPAMAIAVQAAMAGLLVVGSGIAIHFFAGLRERSIFDILTDFVVFSSSIFYMLAVLAVFVLRKKRPDAERPYRTLGYPIVPILYLIFYVWFLSQVYLQKSFEAWVGICLILIGLPIYFLCKHLNSRNSPEISE